MNIKPYSIIQYISTDRYVTIAELSKKTNTNAETLKKQLAKLKAELADSGYYIETCARGIKLVKDESDYLPYDLIIFKSAEFDFIKVFISFICDGMEDKKIFPKMYRDMYYTDRQMTYFFETKINMTFSEFKSKSNFEYFTLFVEYCVSCFNCRNIKKIFDEYVDIKTFNSIMFSQPDYINFSANDYLTIYSILVFEKINSSFISDEYFEIIDYFHTKGFYEGLKSFKSKINYTQKEFTTNAMIDYYYSLTKHEEKEICLNKRYRMFAKIAIELERIQKQLTTNILSYKAFEMTIVYEGEESHLAVIKGTLQGNYPNITINCVPAWIYLYGNVNLSGIMFSNTCISESVSVFPIRDKNGNYKIDQVV